MLNQTEAHKVNKKSRVTIENSSEFYAISEGKHIEPTLSNLKKLYDQLEQYFYNNDLIDLDPEYLATPEQELSECIQNSSIMKNEHKEKLIFFAIRLIMTQLLSSVNEKIGSTDLIQCIKWSDLGDHEE
jgi:hypothetical protein